MARGSGVPSKPTRSTATRATFCLPSDRTTARALSGSWVPVALRLWPKPATKTVLSPPTFGVTSASPKPTLRAGSSARAGGAAAAMVVGYSGMMTEDLEPRMRAIPDVTDFPRTEVIIQKSHRYPFDHQIRQTGAKLIEVETKEEMINAINPKTLAIHFTNILSDKGKVSGAETVEIAKAHNLYTFNDAAADVPPNTSVYQIFSSGPFCRSP